MGLSGVFVFTVSSLLKNWKLSASSPRFDCAAREVRKKQTHTGLWPKSSLKASLMRSSAEPLTPFWFQALVVLWPWAERSPRLVQPVDTHFAPLGREPLHIFLLECQGDRLMPGISAWPSQETNLRAKEVSISCPWPWGVQRCCSVAEALLLSSRALAWPRSGDPAEWASAP